MRSLRWISPAALLYYTLKTVAGPRRAAGACQKTNRSFRKGWLAGVLMSRTRYRMVVPALICAALLTPGMASAGIRIGIGFGTMIGPHYHHGYYGGWYARPHYYHYNPWWYYPAPVIVGSPVVVEPPVVREHVIIEEYRPLVPPKPKAPDLVSQQLQQQKSESLEKLKIGDVTHRVQAVKDLERFENDTKVRTALEKALLSDRDPQVRKAVAELFCRVEDKNALKVLKQAQANDPDRDVRQAAYKAIIVIEGY
jgi:hypothetical protein